MKPDFTFKELQSSYKRLSLFFHPDVKKDSGEDFVFLQMGYNLLKSQKETYLENWNKFNELESKEEILDEKENALNEEESTANSGENPSEQTSKENSPSTGWVKNNFLQFVNIFSGIIFGLFTAVLLFVYWGNVVVSFVFFCIFFALGGVWQNALVFFIIMFELSLISLFSYFIFKQNIGWALVTLPFIYLFFKYGKKILEKVDK